MAECEATSVSLWSRSLGMPRHCGAARLAGDHRNASTFLQPSSAGWEGLGGGRGGGVWQSVLSVFSSASHTTASACDCSSFELLETFNRLAAALKPLLHFVFIPCREELRRRRVSSVLTLGLVLFFRLSLCCVGKGLLLISFLCIWWLHLKDQNDSDAVVSVCQQEGCGFDSRELPVWELYTLCLLGSLLVLLGSPSFLVHSRLYWGLPDVIVTAALSIPPTVQRDLSRLCIICRCEWNVTSWLSPIGPVID